MTASKSRNGQSHVETAATPGNTGFWGQLWWDLHSHRAGPLNCEAGLGFTLLAPASPFIPGSYPRPLSRVWQGEKEGSGDLRRSGLADRETNFWPFLDLSR